MMSEKLRALLLMTLATTGAAASGYFFRPGDWYQELIRPEWTPPDKVFAIVWPVLYALTLLATSFAVWFSQSEQKRAKIQRYYFLQLLFNGLWSFLFFELHWMLVACIDAAVLNMVVWQLMRELKKCNLFLGFLVFPYQVWLLFAVSLNFSLFQLN